MGRPEIEPTELITARICEAIRVGASLQDAAQYAGISRRTLSRWLKRAKNESQHSELYQLQQQVKKARSELVISLLIKINHAANKHWKAAAWKLEHLRPNRFGKKITRSSATSSDKDSE